jgi:hypothetical protein
VATTLTKPEEKLPKNLEQWTSLGRADPVIFAEKLLGMPLHEGQKTYLRQISKKEERIYILSCGNRWGKSVLVSVIQLWHLFYKFGIPEPNDYKSQEAWESAEYRTANIAPHSANTEAVFKTIHAIMTSTFQIKVNGLLRNNECIIGWFYLQDRTLNTPPYKQFFYNNSYIEHRSLGSDQGDSLQGKPYGIITYDEGGRSDHLQNEIQDAILPRLFDWVAPLHIISTPSQDSKSTLHYYELYQNGKAGIKQTWTMEGKLDDNTFFSPGEIDAQKELYRGSPLYEQVINGKFVFGGDTLFPWQDILDALDDNLNDGIRRIDGHKYTLGTDTAIGHDEMVHYVLDTTTVPFQIVRGIAGKGAAKSPQKHLNDFIDLCEAYHEKGNLGHILETWNGESVRFYHDLPPWIQSFTKCYGSWRPDAPKIKNDNPLKPRPNNAKKADILQSLRKILADKGLKIPSDDQKLSQQLQIYREDDKNIPTDRVMALALAVHHATEQIAVSPVWASISW